MELIIKINPNWKNDIDDIILALKDEFKEEFLEITKNE